MDNRNHHHDTHTKMVDHPQHYGGSDSPYEAIKVIEAWSLGFHLGNVIKYICRYRDKGGLEDLKKAKWYLDREIEQYKEVLNDIDQYGTEHPEPTWKIQSLRTNDDNIIYEGQVKVFWMDNKTGDVHNFTTNDEKL